MKTIEFNIGLFNNPLDVPEIIERIVKHPVIYCMGTDTAKVVEGEYGGEVEPTLYLMAFSNISRVSTIIAWVEDLCLMLEQTCIAIKIDGVGYLVYNYTKDTERVSFDESYFKIK